jgi:hypothetical protein
MREPFFHKYCFEAFNVPFGVILGFVAPFATYSFGAIRNFYTKSLTSFELQLIFHGNFPL